MASSAMDALLDARAAWERSQPQLFFDFDELAAGTDGNGTGLSPYRAPGPTSAHPQRQGEGRPAARTPSTKENP